MPLVMDEASKAGSVSRPDYEEFEQ